MGSFLKNGNLWFTNHPDEFNSYMVNPTESQGVTLQGIL